MSRITKVSIISILVVLILSACSNQETTVIDLIPKRKISEFRDSVFLHSVRNILAIENKIILPNKDKVLVLNGKLELQTIIADQGKGPKEFVEVLSTFHYNDQFYLFDNGSHTIKIYDQKGKYETYIKPEGSTSPFVFQRFALANRELLIAGQDSLLQYNIDTHITKAIKPIPQGSFTSTFYTEENDLILVDHTKPTIEIWNTESRESQVIDYSETEFIKKTIGNLDQKNGGTFILVADAYYWDNRLFLLLATLDENKHASKTIAVFSLVSKRIEPKIYKLPNNSYTSICILNDSELLAFSYNNSSLQLFDY